MKKLVHGVGINDAGYLVQPNINGKQVYCPYYRKWKSMLKRCYSQVSHETHPTYDGCEVSEEWKTFSNFRGWMEIQDWIGKELDKDILFTNNRIYSEDTCVFVDKHVNQFLASCNVPRGKYMIGVAVNSRGKKFIAQCSNDGKSVKLGSFDTELEAHLVWKTYKHNLACKLADEQSDPRVAEALRSRFV